MIAEKVQITTTPTSLIDLLKVPGAYLTDDDDFQLFADDGVTALTTDGGIRSNLCEKVLFKYNDMSDTVKVKITDPDTTDGAVILDGANGVKTKSVRCTKIDDIYIHSVTTATNIDILIFQK